MHARSTIWGSTTLTCLAAPTVTLWHDELAEADRLERETGTCIHLQNIRFMHRSLGFEIREVFRDPKGKWGIRSKDGGEILISRVSRDIAISAAARWHGKKPTHREVVMAREDARPLLPRPATV